MTDDEPVVEPAWELAGVPDGFGRLWTPYRMAYLQGENKPADAGSGECPFCRAPRRPDEEGLVVARGDLAFVVMNLYPYNTGHTMVAPYRHVGDLEELSSEDLSDLMALVQRVVVATKDAMSPDAFNIGMNLGRAAGAGLPGHLHVHLVPRWAGDTNFMPVLGDTKVMPETLDDTYRKIRARLHAGPAS